jgi:hypothetical protein
MVTQAGVVDPRAAAELASATGLPCVLRGLASCATAAETGTVHVANLTAIVVPFDCAGGVAALGADQRSIPLVAVRSNRCRVGIAADQLQLRSLVEVRNHAEAVAYLVARRAGVRWRAMLDSPLAVRKL